MTSIGCLQLFYLLFLHTYSYHCYSVVYLSCYLVILWLQFILLLFCAHCLHARAVLFTHTLTKSLSDDPRFARPNIGRFVSIVQVFDETVLLARNWTLSLLILIFFPFFIPTITFDSCISHLASILFLTSFEIMCSLICIIAVIADYYSSDL